MNTTLARALELEKESDYLDFSIDDIVKEASLVIVPLGPINTFAARNPWVGMEGQSFEQVARRFKETCDVDLYPNDSMLQSARKRGEINLDFLENRLQHWLDLQQSLEIPRDEAERFCRAALMLEEQSFKQIAVPELKSLAKKLNRFTYQITEKHSIQTYSQRLEELDGENVAKELNCEVIKWCKLFLDESQAVWSMPNRNEGFYKAWKRLVHHDNKLNHNVRKQLKDLPEEADHALMEALLALEIPYSKIKEYLEAHLLALPGWAGMMLWRSQQSTGENSLLIEYLAVRISTEYALLKSHLPLPKQEMEDKVLLEPLIASWVNWGDLPIKAWSQFSPSEIKARLTLAYRFDNILRNRLWLEAWEKTYENQLRNMITSKQNIVVENVKPALAQFVFCIDVRSEPFRRQLEQAGPFETFGTAGFFGLPIETCELGSNHSHDSLPVMFKPKFKVQEYLPKFELKQFQQRLQASNSLSYTFKTMKHNLFSSMLLPEVSGPWLSLQTLARSFIPRSSGYIRKIRETWLRKPSTEISLDHEHTSDSELPIGFSEEEKVYYARQALQMMGLTENFAPLVVICGHGSHSTNNPYASSLDCGACGGSSSGFNARVLAALCNLPKVRQTLETEGISIPKDTVFVAAEHITTLDELRFLYVPKLSDAAQEAYTCIEATMPKVSDKANAERICKLPDLNSYYKNPQAEAQCRAEDWSEVRPEWGLARNATFIIGDRKLTKECNLDGRAFLHNYNWHKDQNGTLLDNIITGPETVAQWINLQYYASTVAPHYYGSGDKRTQTVTAGIGVMQGNASDLLSGLPWQSVMQSDQEFYHAPLRLLVVIQAPRKYVKRLLDHNPIFYQKVRNGWLQLASVDSEGYWENWS